MNVGLMIKLMTAFSILLTMRPSAMSPATAFMCKCGSRDNRCLKIRTFGEYGFDNLRGRRWIRSLSFNPHLFRTTPRFTSTVKRCFVALGSWSLETIIFSEAKTTPSLQRTPINVLSMVGEQREMQ